jgi:predicted lipid-binding transport protein (Tim44 family)
MTVEPHWLTRPATIRKLWWLFIGVLAGVVLAGLLIGPEGHFAVEGLFGFNALFGFLACAALILIAKAIGILLKRPDTYYDQREHDA